MGTQGEHVFVGSYTADKFGAGEGIALLRRDPSTGLLSRAGLVARTPSPSFLAQHPTRPVLYAVNELASHGTVSAYAVAPDGSLEPLSVQPTGGADPAHLAVTDDGRYLLVANYTSGSVAVHPLDVRGVPGERTDLLELTGSGPDPDRQAGSHAHMVRLRGSAVLVADLGADRVWRARLDRATGRLCMAEPAVVPPGTGPRHLLRTPDTAVLIVGELAANLSWYRPDADGALKLGGAAPASTSPRRNLPSELVMAADGRFVYVANRGPDTVSTFAWDGVRATLISEVPTGGAGPRHMLLIGGYLHVANQVSHSVTTLRVDPRTGIPTLCGELTGEPSPTCLHRWACV